MKVFISWSGPLSKKLGEAIRDWLPGVLQLVTPYFTADDIEKGARWSSEIAHELSESQVGILCITRDNLHSEWIMFEAGALSKTLENTRVCPILFGITNTDLVGPLKQFQTTAFDKADFHKFVAVVNGKLGDSKLPSITLDMVFNKWWPDLEEKIKGILEHAPANDDAPIRADRDILEEILQNTRRASLNSGSKGQSSLALRDLIEGFVKLHDAQVAQDGTYQDTLDALQRMSKPLRYLCKYTRGEELPSDVLECLRRLTYQTQEQEELGFEGDDAPF